MPLTTNAKTLYAAAGRVTSGNARRPAAPIAACVRITPGLIESYDLDLYHAARIDVAGDGVVIVNAAQLRAALKPIGKAEVTLTAADGAVELVSASGATITLAAEAESDWPAAPIVTGEPRPFPLATSAAALPFASRDETRPVLTTIHYNGRVSATDSYRLVQIETGDAESDGANVHYRAAQRILAAKPAAATITIGDECVRTITAESDTITSRLRLGKYPSVDSLFPDSTDAHHLLLDAAALRGAVAGAVAAARHNEPVRIYPRTGILEVLGKYAATVPLAASVDVDPIGVNPGFLRDQIALVAGDTVGIDVLHPLRPLRIDGQLETGEPFRSLLMPTRLS